MIRFYDISKFAVALFMQEMGGITMMAVEMERSGFEIGFGDRIQRIW